MADNTDQKPDFEIPDDFEDESAFLEQMRQDFHDDVEADRENLEASEEDTEFLVGNQWDPAVRARRESAKKPVLTFNRFPAFIAQLVGNRRLNETSLKVAPDGSEDKNIARIREGLIRNIEKVSRASVAYDRAFECAVTGGLGNFKLELDWDSDDIFAQTLRIVAINDPTTIVWDRTLQDPTGADAGHAFEIETWKAKDFRNKWPWATPADLMVSNRLTYANSDGWFKADDVRVVAYWRMRTRPRTLAMMQDGKVRDITDDQEDPETIAQIAQNPDTGEPIMREVNRKYAQRYLCSGTDILEGPYDLPISRIPIYRVPGWEVQIKEKKHRWGIIRFLKDPLRLHNYWRSVIAEHLQMAPKATWLAGQSAVAGRENEWRQSHLSDDPLLIWNDESGQKPERNDPPQIEAALLTQAESTVQDIKDISNIHEASLGMPSNEVSGAAIIARQRVSDTGTIIYHDNVNAAIEQVGISMNELIPVVYDTARVVKVLGDDGREELQEINGFGKDSVDITDGKYNVTVTTGPSYVTKRLEAQASMMAFINAVPQVAGYTLDLLAQAQDWPQADEFARRARLMLPPGMINPKDLTPDELQMYQAQQQQAAKTQAVAIAKELAELQKTQAQTAEAAARARNFNAEAEAQPINTNTKAVSAASQAADRELRGHLEAVRVATGD